MLQTSAPIQHFLLFDVIQRAFLNVYVGPWPSFAEIILNCALSRLDSLT
jgi:hypothetical protein